MLERHGTRHRFGAIGRSGSIALIERLFRTLKTLGRFRESPPLLKRDLERRLGVVLAYYVWLRPHRSLGAATPAEMLLGRQPAHLDAVPPPRGRPGERSDLPPPFVIQYLDPQRYLPYLVRKAA